MAKRTAPRPAKKVAIHKPGEDPVYTDEELLVLPFPVLNSAQAARKRTLERRLRDNARRAAQQKTRKPGETPDSRKNKEYCVHIKRNGDRCGGFQCYGTEHCRWHLTEDEERAAGLRPALMKPGAILASVETSMEPMAVYRRAVEKSLSHMINKQLNLVGLQLTGFDAMGDPIIEELPGGGVKLHGESKDGDIRMTQYENTLAIFEATMKMMDRVWGKPRQTTVIEGGKTAVKVEPVRSVERSAEVARLLGQIGAVDVPHEGRQRRRTSETPTHEESK